MIKNASLIVRVFSLVAIFFVAPANAQDNNASRLVPIISFILDDSDQCPRVTQETTRTITEPIANQAQLNALQGVTRIDGDLIFSAPSLASFDFSALESLVELRGKLEFDTPALGSIRGFDCLSLIEGNVRLISNRLLTSIQGFGALTSIRGDLQILFNDALTSIPRFGALTEVGGRINIRSNADLDSIDEWFEALTSVGGDLDIGNNNALTSIQGFGSLTEVGGRIDIAFNDVLASVDEGFKALTKVGADLNIVFNIKLTSVQGFAAINEIGGDLDIRGNNLLTSIQGFSNLEFSEVLGEIEVRNNQNLDCSNPAPNFLPATISEGNAVNCVLERVFTTFPALAIPDNSALGVSSNIIISNQPGTVGSVNVLLDITHTFIGDLLVTLSNGTQSIELIARPKMPNASVCSTSNIESIRLTDDSPLSINTNCGSINPAFPTGDYAPHASLSAFNGLSVNGTWTLKVEDLASRDLGTLNNWGLEFVVNP